ncbi:MAG: hypothetical protein IPI60_07515 [Saprospiraceae bacterium]|nr:hypothetical protein [Saprospiraceae bacterium]
MKSFIAVFSLLLITSAPLHAQSIKDVFDKNTKVVFLGLDFTRVKIIGEPLSKTEDIVAKQFTLINEKFVNERKKFDLNKVFNKPNLSTAIGKVNKRNESIDPSTLLSEDSDDYQRLQAKDIDELVKNFDFNGKTGTGLLFVVEGYNKAIKEISVYVTYINLDTKKVILTERATGELGAGFTYANYWLSGFKSLMDNIGKKEYKAWKAKYKA